MDAEVHLDTFPALAALGVPHGFTGRVAGLDLAIERDAAIARLDAHHRDARAKLGLGAHVFATAEQIHGAHVALVDASSAFPAAQADGLITADPRVCLGIHVADCGPVFIVEPARRVVALLHSGRRGTEQRISTAAIGLMVREFGCDPARMIVQLGPCIRPPQYEVDFAAGILRQAREAGVREVHDCARCTASDPARYYSYRREQGKTGRMLALLALAV